MDGTNSTCVILGVYEGTRFGNVAGHARIVWQLPAESVTFHKDDLQSVGPRENDIAEAFNTASGDVPSDAERRR